MVITLKLSQEQFMALFASMVIQRALPNSSDSLKEVGLILWRDYRHLLTEDQKQIFEHAFKSFDKNHEVIEKTFDTLLDII